MAEPGHEIVNGTIGMGKSYLVLYKIVASLRQGKPLCYIDPKGDTYRNLLAYFVTTEEGQKLWSQYQHKILFLNPVSKSDYLLSFNALEPMGMFSYASPDPVALLSNTIVSFLRKQSGFEMADANRMQNIMNASIGLLVEGGAGKLTLGEIPLLFLPNYEWNGKRKVQTTYNPIVESLLKNTTHMGTRAFWEIQWSSWTSQARMEWPQSTEGRIFQYLFDQRTNATICAVDNARLSFRKLIDEGYWLFVNIPYPLLSDTVSTLLGNLIITKLFYACMQRPPASSNYRIILDEARFFNTGPLDVILETSRAYNLWMTLVVQSLDQMCRTANGQVDERLKETALNNVRYMATFHNVADVKLLASLMFPVTGRVVTGTRQSGDYEYLPVQAETNDHEQRFTRLQKREVVIYDKFNPKVKKWYTPTLNIGQVDQGQLDLFEARHLQLTGRPITEINREIQDRQAHLRLSTPPTQPTFGGQL